jgi:hypothetical protein
VSDVSTTLDRLAEQFLSYKRALGVKYKTGEYYLRTFLTYANSNNPTAQFPTRELVSGWCARAADNLVACTTWHQLSGNLVGTLVCADTITHISCRPSGGRGWNRICPISSPRPRSKHFLSIVIKPPKEGNGLGGNWLSQRYSVCCIVAASGAGKRGCSCTMTYVLPTSTLISKHPKDVVDAFSSATN